MATIDWMESHRPIVIAKRVRGSRDCPSLEISRIELLARQPRGRILEESGIQRPDLADDSQFSLDSPNANIQLMSDFVVAVAVQFGDRDPFQRRVTQLLQKMLALIGNLSREFGRRLGPDHLVDPTLPVTSAEKHRLAPHGTTAPLLATIVRQLIHGFSSRDHDQNLPQIVAVLELREATSLDTAVEAVERHQDHVFLVRHTPRSSLQLLSGQPDQLLEVLLPNSLARLGIALFGEIQPASD